MTKIRALEIRFVVHVPEKLDSGVLYVSMECAVATHLCCCGCGSEVVTPFTPDGWKITFDGESLSLWPSVGNWNLPCRSHYVIDRSRVVEVPERDRTRIGIDERHRPACTKPAPRVEAGTPPRQDGFWRKLKRSFSRKKS